MAGRREWTQDFVLNARLNGGFNSTFSKAQAEFARLKKEVRALEQVQKDVSAYQKQQQAITATTEKLRNLEKQQALVRQQIKEAQTAGESTAALEREELKLQQQIKNANDALERQKEKLTATGERLKAAGVDTADLTDTSRALKDTLKELGEEQKRAAGGAQTLGEKTAAGFAAAGQALAAAGAVAAVKELTNAFAACVGIAGDFEAAMSAVEALSQANERDMAALTAQAKELGATTKFTAKESADAMGYMAMAGWDAAEMLQGMNGVLQLAAASGEDLAMVSDIVTDSLSAFGLTAADTAHFSDVLAAAATNSNTNVAIMGETFKMSASVAGALGYSIEDVAAAMGLMANSGVKGSIAGTALRNTFNGLLAGVTLTGRAFGEYEFSAIRADGTMKSFGATMEELRGYFQQMTEAERVSNAQAIAGQRGYNGLLAILNAADADYQSLTSSINNCTGAAARMASVRLDNLKGQVTLMNSAWDALKTTIGELFIPELRKLAEAGTDAMTWVDGFIRDHPALTKGVMAFTGAMSAAVVAVTGVNAALKLFKVLDVAAMFSGPVVGIIGAAAAVAGVTAAVAGLVEKINEGVPSVKELTESARSMGKTMEEASGAYEKTAEETLAAAGVADIYIRRLEAMGDRASLSAEKQQEYHDILSLLCQTVPELAQHIDLESNTIKGGTAALRANTESWKQNAMAQAMQERMTAMYAAQADVLIEQEKNRLRLTEAEAKAAAAEERLNAARAKATALYQESQKNGTELTQEYYNTQEAISALALEYQEAVRPIDAYQKAVDAGAEAAAAAEAELDRFAAAMDSLTGAAAEQAGTLPELEHALGPVRNEIDRLAAAYDAAYDAALSSIAGQYALWDEAAEVAPASAASVNAALESQAKYWREYNKNIRTILDNASDIAGLNEMLAGLDAGDKDTVNFVAGLAQASVKDKKALEEMVRNWQEAKRQQEEAAGSFSEYASGLAGEMDGLREELAQSVRDLDLSNEAAESARATIQAYIDQTEAMKEPLKNAVSGLWRSVMNTMPAVVPVASAVSSADIQAPAKKGKKPFGGYASGTQSAVPGWAWVGEDGPELMRFRGGEQVLNARQSAERKLQQSYGDSPRTIPSSSLLASPGWAGVGEKAPGRMRPAGEQTHSTWSGLPSVEPAAAGNAPQVQFVFNISGDATPETVQDLRAFGDEIVSRVLDALEDARAGRARRAIR